MTTALVTTLGDICAPKQHPTISSNDLLEAGYPVYGANGRIGFYDSYTHSKPTIAVTCRGATCGTIHVVPAFSYITGNAMALDNLNEERVDIAYLAWCLRARGFYDVISGSAQPQITRQPLQKIRLALPPLDEQRRIAAILDQADYLRRKRRLALAKLYELPQAIFHEMFGDLASNEKTWLMKPLGDVVNVIGGFAFRSADFADAGPGVVRISNLRDGVVDLSDIARIPMSRVGKGAKYAISGGDILMAMSGATTGKVGVVPFKLPDDLYLNQRVANFRISASNTICREFLIVLICSDYYQKMLWQTAGGVAQPNVSSGQLEAIPIPVPPITTQRTFSKKVIKIETLRELESSHLKSLDMLFASLQGRAFAGVSTKLSPAEAAVASI